MLPSPQVRFVIARVILNVKGTWVDGVSGVIVRLCGSGVNTSNVGVVVTIGGSGISIVGGIGIIDEHPATNTLKIMTIAGD